jgi:hypothetical protein
MNTTGGSPLSENDKKKCLFCGSPNLTTDSGVEGVQQHSHRARRADAIACEDCGGAFMQFYSVTARRTSSLPPDPSDTLVNIPEDWTLIVCPNCAEIIEARKALTEHHRDYLARLLDGEIETDCCGVGPTMVWGQYGRYSNGQAWRDLAPREVVDCR